MRELLGGKGANVAEMTRILGRRPRAGRVHDHDRGVRRLHARRTASPRASTSRSTRRWRALEEHAGKQLGDAEDPLLVSVRSGARESMPGMLDTVLNLGLNDESVAGPGREAPATSASPGTPTGASCRCSATSCAASRASASRTRSSASRPTAASRLDTELDVEALQRAHARASRSSTSSPPTRASSSSRRSAPCSTPGTASAPSTYRRINRIPDDWGTAVNVQQMVFGNKGDDERLRRRLQPRRGDRARPSPSGDFLSTPRARTSSRGVRNTQRHRRARRRRCPTVHAQLMEILRTLERHYGDMQDTEFTVEEGRLYMLQTRNAKRPAQAAVRFAVDAVDEGLLDKAAGAARRSTPRRSTRCCTRPSTRDAEYDVLATRRRRLARRGQGRDRLHRRRRGRRPPPTGATSILVRPFTEADDVAGFHAAKGILTSEGGKASHAALVARGMGVPAVTGASDARDRPRGGRGARRTAPRCTRATGSPSTAPRARSRPTTCRSSSPRSATRSTRC